MAVNFDYFSGLKTSAASVTSTASTTSVASFHQKKYWFWWFDDPWHQNDQYLSLFFGIDHQKSNFLLFLAPFLSEAVEASWCYFFGNWFLKLKFFYLLKPLGTIIQQNYWSFYFWLQNSWVNFRASCDLTRKKFAGLSVAYLCTRIN